MFLRIVLIPRVTALEFHCKTVNSFSLKKKKIHEENHASLCGGRSGASSPRQMLRPSAVSSAAAREACQSGSNASQTVIGLQHFSKKKQKQLDVELKWIGEQLITIAFGRVRKRTSRRAMGVVAPVAHMERSLV